MRFENKRWRSSLDDKIRIGVSSCLMGLGVRFDGNHKHFPWLTKELSKAYELQTFCPEVIMGLGVPRPAIGLYINEKSFELRRNKDLENLSEKALSAWQALSDELLQLDAFIFKSKSPSCGLNSAFYDKIDGDQTKKTHQKTDGFFVQFLKEIHPDCYLIDERSLKDDSQKGQFLDYLKSLQ